jgi:hypothetical protein
MNSTRTLALTLSLIATLPAPAHATTPRDGAHDFDFNQGTWHTHIRRILDPLTGATHSIELNGTVTVRPVWQGRAQLEEIEVDGPKGHWEGMTIFLYNPQSRQWTQSFIGSDDAQLGTQLIGQFHDGRGELYAQETFQNKFVLIRGVWSNITPNAHNFEEDFSNDGGHSWHPVFVAELYRETTPTSVAPPATSPEDDPQHAFDFDLGAWKTHSTRLDHPLTGSHTWLTLDGTTTVKPIWAGRANLAEYIADGPAGHVQLLSLRWFNPNTHEWYLDFATPTGGTLGIPGTATFHDGRADFYDVEPLNGRSILVRFSIWKISPTTAQSEQAFSGDGGKTWEVNWINKYTRE